MRLPLAGLTVGIDPGHNGENFTDPAYINHLIWDGREMKACNTTGTATDSGYSEAQFNFNVASDLATDLLGQGARVVMTRHTNTGVGPCTNVRAAILNRSGAAVAINIHADGGPASGRGVAVLEPVPDGPAVASGRFEPTVAGELVPLPRRGRCLSGRGSSRRCAGACARRASVPLAPRRCALPDRLLGPTAVGPEAR